MENDMSTILETKIKETEEKVTEQNEYMSFLKKIDNSDIVKIMNKIIHNDELELGDTILEKEIEKFISMKINSFKSYPQRVVDKIKLIGPESSMYRILSAINEIADFVVYFKMTESGDSYLYILYKPNYCDYKLRIKPLIKNRESYFDVAASFLDVTEENIRNLNMDPDVENNLLILNDKLGFAESIIRSIKNMCSTVISSSDYMNKNNWIDSLSFKMTNTLDINRESLLLRGMKFGHEFTDLRFAKQWSSLTVPKRDNPDESISVNIGVEWVLDYLILRLLLLDNVFFNLDTVFTDTLNKGAISTSILRIKIQE